MQSGKPVRNLLGALCMFGISTGSAPAASATSGSVNAITVPAIGSSQRAAIVDAVRPVVEQELGGSIEFVIQCVAVSAGRSYVIAEPQRRGGGKIRYSEYDYPFGITVVAALAFREGRWNLLRHVIGDSDVWYFDGAPPSLRTARCY